MLTTEAAVTALAPDAASLSSGRELARPGKWTSLGRAGDVAWGEVFGSGSKPYRTVVDLVGEVAKCSCPSRKLPCKHSLALMLVAMGSPGSLVAGDMPEWAASWADGRAAKASGVTASPKPVDAKGRAKRRADRDARVLAGTEELDLWLRDVARRGLASVRSEPYAFWDRMAARLVDAQAPGLGRRVRSLGSLAAQPGAAAAEPFALALGRLGLLAKAVQRTHALDPDTVDGLAGELGHAVPPDAMAERPEVHDDWMVVAQGREQLNKLVERATWIVGAATGRVARVLDYSPTEGGLPPGPAPGRTFRGGLAFHPGFPELRAAYRDGELSETRDAGLGGPSTVADALASWTAVMARAPWIERWPVRLCGVRVGMAGRSDPALGDGTGCLRLAPGPWIAALAVATGGGPVDVLGLHDGLRLQPLAMVAAGRRYSVSPSSPRLSRVA